MGRKHRKFAADSANFLQLDCVLARVQRRTGQEIQQQQRKREERRQSYCGKIQGEVTPCSDLPLPILTEQIQRMAQADDAEMTAGGVDVVLTLH